jgi:hypothetical protein
MTESHCGSGGFQLYIDRSVCSTISCMIIVECTMYTCTDLAFIKFTIKSVKFKVGSI